MLMGSRRRQASGDQGRAAAPRPLSRGATAVSAALERAWSLPPRTNYVAVQRGLRVPMSDGTTLLADHYLPIVSRPAATVLVRCPYGRGLPFSLLEAQLLAERGYHVLLQSCRGTFGSGGEFEPMRHEAADGQDTVAWLRGQSWFDGRLATYGLSYLGFVQWALAMDPPSELVAAVVHVGPHDFSRSIYRHGVLDLYNYLAWSDLMAHQESIGPVSGAMRVAGGDRRVRAALDRMPISVGARELLGTGAPWFEVLLEHPQLTDSFWAPMQCGAALDRMSAPTLLVGAWQDIFLGQTLEQYRALAARGVPTRLLVGPWTHQDTLFKGGTAVAESLAWLDRYAGTGTVGSEAGGRYRGHPVRIWVGGSPQRPGKPGTTMNSGTARVPDGLRRLGGLGSRDGATGEWREISDWPPAGPGQQRWYLGAGGTLSPAGPAADADVTPARFRYDPADPTPSVGGATLALNAGTRDNRQVEQRPDILVFSSEPLDEPVEVIGYVTAELSVTRDNPHADVFVRLCDVDPRGRSRNICDGIVRLTDADPLAGTVRVSLIAAAHRFGRGHRIRLQVAGGAHPRFARNPGNGQVDAAPADLVPTRYTVGLGAGAPSVLLLAAADHATAGPAGKAAVHA
jgi:uncharacterized protein